MAGVSLVDSSPADASIQSGMDGGVMVLDSFQTGALNQPVKNGKYEKTVKKSLKRKRVSIDSNVSSKEKESLTSGFRQELDELFTYFKEALVWKFDLEEGVCCSINSAIACLLEGSDLSFTKLADEIYEKLKLREGVTLASVHRDVHFVAFRSKYGIDNENPNMLEDESELCLWCWETRDLKLLPKTQRGILEARRRGREKVRERIIALSDMISALSASEDRDCYKSDLLKASEKLGKTLYLEEIRSLVEKLMQRNGDKIAKKEAKLQEKVLLKEIERNKQNAEKENKRLDRELQKEKLHSEKELKRCQDEVEKEERRREKEEAELKKQLKRQQDEAEREQKRKEKEEAELKKQLKRQKDEADKEQRRREKEEAELKRQLSIQKQATLMERFLKNKKHNNLEIQFNKSSMDALSSDCSGKNKEIASTAVLSMDSVLSHQDSMNTEDLWKSHIAAWHKLCSSNRSQRWGIRCKPKTKVIKELKLQGSSSEPEALENIITPNKRHTCVEVKCRKSHLNKLVDHVEEDSTNNMSTQNDVDIAPNNIQLSNRTKKLLQFDKSHRPAYYGTWSKKSDTVGPHHPFAKDPYLDYAANSDEEWEEEEPGESLSDCDKDDEEEILERDLKADDEDESEDSFLVPDGYLSENEGGQVDSLTVDDVDDEARSSPDSKADTENEEFRALLRQQKYLSNLTQQALRKNQPLIISNLMHEKSEIMMGKDLAGTAKLEHICLQTLCMLPCPDSSIIEPPVINSLNEDPEFCQSQIKSSSTPVAAAAIILDSDLPEFVKCIRSYPHGLPKMVELLQQKFSSISKTQLRNKVREISDFVDNRWQIKKEILDRLGLSVSPGAPPPKEIEGVVDMAETSNLAPKDEITG